MPLQSRVFLRALDVPCPRPQCEGEAKAMLMLCVSPWRVRVLYRCCECGVEFGSTFVSTQAGYVTQQVGIRRRAWRSQEVCQGA